MVTPPSCLKAITRELTAEQIIGLQSYKVSTERGSVVFSASVSESGTQVDWRGRVYMRTVSGPFPLNAESLKAIDAPLVWLEEPQQFLKGLQPQFPALQTLPAMGPDRPALAEKSPGTKDPKSEG